MVSKFKMTDIFLKMHMNTKHYNQVIIECFIFSEEQMVLPFKVLLLYLITALSFWWKAQMPANSTLHLKNYMTCGQRSKFYIQSFYSKWLCQHFLCPEISGYICLQHENYVFDKHFCIVCIMYKNKFATLTWNFFHVT